MLLFLMLFKKIHMKLAGVVEKLGKGLTQGTYLSYHNELFSFERFN